MFILKTGKRVVANYDNKEWAIHSAKCYAGFFCCTVWVIDSRTGEIIHTEENERKDNVK